MGDSLGSGFGFRKQGDGSSQSCGNGEVLQVLPSFGEVSYRFHCVLNDRGRRTRRHQQSQLANA